jgi:hypothetical protein
LGLSHGLEVINTQITEYIVYEDCCGSTTQINMEQARHL